MFLSALLLSMGCIYPTHDGNPVVLEEQQSVWQYLSVYSIFQERLPAEVGSRTPYDLFNMINDSLRRSRYTEYLDDRVGGGAMQPGQEIGEPVRIAPKTVYFYIPDFSDESYTTFNVWADRMGDSEFENIIIDLRYNGGGLISAVHGMLCEMLPRGTEYIQNRRREYDAEARRGHTVKDCSKTENQHPPLLVGKKFIVLMNGSSASASEIMAAALKEKSPGAVLTGDTSYGKGIGQVHVTRPGRKRLSITHLQLEGLTSKTGDYHKKGLPPDTLPGDKLTEEEELVAEQWALLAAPNKTFQNMFSAAHNGYNSIVMGMWIDILTIPAVPNVNVIRGMLYSELRELYCAIKLVYPDYSPPPPPLASPVSAKAFAQERIKPVSRQALAEMFKPTGAYEVVDELPEL
jgi:hypothetical protein